MTDRQSAVLDRVRKLLALAGSPNVHEAAAAAARAQSLIAAHRLEGWLAEEPGEPIEDARDAPLEVARRLRRWRVVLGSALAELNGCAAYTLRRPDGDALVLVGRASDREAVRALYDGLVRRLEWLSATAGPGKSKRWHEAFRIGAVETVVARLAERAEPDPPDGDGSAALVLAAASAHRDRLERFVAERLGLRPGRGIPVDGRALALGRAHGRDLPLPE